MYLSKLWQKRLSDGHNSTIKSPPVRLYHSSTQISLARFVEYPLESVCTAFYHNQNEVVLLGWNSSHLINCCCHKSNQFCTRSPNMVDDSRSRGCKQCIAGQAGGDGSTLADLWKAENRFPGPVGPPTTFVGGEKLNNKLSNEVELESAAIALYFPAHPGSIMAAPSTFIINHHCNMLK